MKSYAQYCGTAAALDILGERWTLLILRDLLTGPCRYSDLMNSLPGITTNLLAKRLQMLQSRDLITQSPQGYTLTNEGQSTKPIILALAEFGTNHLVFPPPHTQHNNARWLVLNLHNRYLGGWQGEIGLAFKSSQFLVLGQDDHLDITQTDTLPETCLSATGPGLARWILMGASLDRQVANRSIRLTGPAEPALSLDACLSTLA